MLVIAWILILAGLADALVTDERRQKGNPFNGITGVFAILVGALIIKMFA